MKLAIDAMGGDHAPKEIVLGAMKAIEAFSDLEIILVGDERKIKEYLSNEGRISIVHTEEVILGTDEPVRAVRRKRTRPWCLLRSLSPMERLMAVFRLGIQAH